MPAQSEHIRNLLQTLPHKPGVYHHLDKDGKILYIGKAKDLRKRVGSYFAKKHDNARIQWMVSRVADIHTIVTETEYEALLLENTLIKELRPRYNINLRDDKTYPWICIRNERFPRIHATRNVVQDGSEYFGPYASVKVMKTVLGLIRQLYTLRTCNLNLSEKNIASGKFKVCLEYHIGNCKGPCEGFQTEEDYNRDVEAARAVIRGNLTVVTGLLKERMMKRASELKFEEAQREKERIELLQKYRAKSTVVSTSISNVDVFSVVDDASHSYVNYLKVIEGAVVLSHTLELKKKLNENKEIMLELAIPELRQMFKSDSKEIYLSHKIDVEFPGVKASVPQRGDKRKIVELSIRNAMHHRAERLKNIQIVDPDRHVNRLMEQMKHDLRMSVEPRLIECFDNSNFQGTEAVSACVVFRNGKPAKNEYRHFNVKTVEGPDDFATMEEVIHRRYSRLLSEGADLPQLIVIDGGKGQLSAAINSLEILGLRGKITIIGIAKRLEEIYFPNDPVPLYLDKRSETLRVIQQARNEAHRFGITHHRKRRSKRTIKSSLDEIPGIGPTTVTKLLREFKSVKGVRNAEIEELVKISDKRKAQAIWSYFHPDE